MKLWDFYDGEPFMENPHVMVLGNPGTTRKKKTRTITLKNKKGVYMATRRRRTGRKNSPPRRRRMARRNFPTAGLAFNPRRRRRTRRMSTNPRRRRSSYRRNPAVLGVALPPINMIAWGAAGFVAPPMVENFVNQFIPAEFSSSTLGRYAVKIGSVLGLTFLAKNVLSAKEAFPIALGGSLYVVTSAINEFLPQLVAPPAPATGTSAYRTGMIKGVGAYRRGMIATGVGAYSRPGLAAANPGLANRWSLGQDGMQNPVASDPRFATSVARMG